MAAIGTIRKHSTLLVVVIGVALAAFVLGDFIKRRRTRDVNIGVVDGKEITVMEFNNRYEQYLENTKQQKQTSRISEAEQARIRIQTWNQMVREILMGDEYKELGLDVTADELYDMIQGPNPHPLVVQSFTDPNTGKFDRNKVIQYLQNLDNYPPEAKQRWIEFEKYLKEDRLRQKFNALIEKGYYVPKALAIKEYEDTYDNASTDFVAKKISSVPDSVVNVTEEDYMAYYDKNKEKFKTDASRDLKFVIIKVVPSQKDIQKAKKDIISLKNELAKIDAKDVSRFIKVNSDVPYDSSWKEKGQLPAEIDSVMFVEKPGYVSDYWFKNNKYHVARLMAVAERPDSLRAAHILIAYKGAYRANPAIDRSKEEAKKLADSLMAVLKKNPKKLESLAQKYSDDPSARTNKGDLGWFKDGRMVPSFNEAVVNTKVNGVTIAETPYGYHIIEVLGKKDPVKKVKVAELVFEVLPSNETYQTTFALASKLATEAKTSEEFDKKAKDMGLQVMTQPKIREITSNIRGYNNVRPVVRWAFKDNTEVGDVSGVFDLDGAYMVAVVTGKADKGYPPLEDVKPYIERAVINLKKGNYIASLMKNAGTDLESIASKMKLSIDHDNSLTFKDNQIGTYNNQYKAIGTVFGLDKGEVSKPVVDKSAVFVLKQNFIKSSADKAKKDYKNIVKKIEKQISQQVNSDLPYNAIEKSSDIVDNRIKFY